MALIFPHLDDTIKSRSYSEVEKNSDNYRYIKSLNKGYNQAKEEWLSKGKRTLEQKLSHLAEMWVEAVNDKSKEKINQRALQLIQGCCKIRKGFTGEAKEYYRTYRNLRKILSGEKQFYIGYA
jgi:hypothetical protein|tara:strand:- start:925 stop:1293 length:369 start_codon:yes stop_codon:yes gene_type:complete